ncbi:MAG: hypothetical protein D3922_12530, partial [Candidatus Electrothrix sp. AR1]|nr:hypothetical protein [Candidatus Electrothrix sp. AR1]
YGNVTDVHSEGTIQGVAVLGVLGGDARYSKITQTSSSGLVDGYNGGDLSRIFYGGLLGGNEKTDLSCSSSDAEVIGNYRVGGLVGHNDGTISSSFATGTVEGVYRVGGLAGENVGGTISDTFATGAVSGLHEVAGLVGLQYESAAIIERSYATGTATGGVNTRGLLGMKMAGTCSSTFWDVTTSGITSDSCDSAGLTTDEMQDQSTYVGWDFDDTWTMSDHPELQCPRYSISSCSELQAINNNLSGSYYLAHDIDCAGFDFGDGGGFMPIGDDDTPFTGTFDGKGFTISNVFIERPEKDNVGVFGIAGVLDGTASTTISNVTLEGFNITGRTMVGSLFGRIFYGSVDDVHSDGVVTGIQWIGGLGGDVISSTVTHASSSGSVFGDQSGRTDLIFYGGLIGCNRNDSVISCSRSNVNIAGNYRVGGLVGSNIHATINTSFATGTVSGFYRVGGLTGENIGG